MSYETKSRRPEIWGGLECTVNRVGDRYFSQLERCRHYDRPDDLVRVASLGIEALRYPVLWEQVAPHRPEEMDWSRSDAAIAQLRELGVRPIIGTVHHGSGPCYTNLLSDDFAPGLARFARAVAERYPHVVDYTPVNEPLTTARFSALYGHWYPHAADPLSFARALLNEVRATVLAMREIRKVNPAARLIQTDDLGKTHSTARLSYQADFENERRWITWDLLAGTLDRSRPMWGYLQRLGISEQELGWFLDNPCPADVVGVNHYLTSERFLDHRLDRYPLATHGGNGRDQYADVEAVRVLAEGPDGLERLLRETRERYGAKVAVTECHLGCTREEQIRWLRDVYGAAERADAEAVTVWAILGSHGWCNLLTCEEGAYETGVFDLRGPVPRATALAGAVRDLVAGSEPRHPAAAGPGWWSRGIRLEHPPVLGAAGPLPSPDREPGPPIRILGDDPMWQEAFRQACEQRGLSWVADDPEGVAWATVLLAPSRPMSMPVGGRLLALSSAHAFSGDGPFGEGDVPNGDAAVRRFEDDVLSASAHALVVRPGRSVPATVGSDQWVSLAPVRDLVHAALDLLIDGECGLWHLAQAPLRGEELRGVEGIRVVPEADEVPALRSDRGSILPKSPVSEELGDRNGVPVAYVA